MEKDPIDTAKAGEDQEKRSGFVTMVGRPNVGKSTLMNALIGQKIAITSNKPQTTRNRILTVDTEAEGQIVFLDTPGIHEAKNRLGEFMMEEVRRALGNVDLVLFLVGPLESASEISSDKKAIDAVKRAGLPFILVINKADTVAREALLPAISSWEKACPGVEIVPVSALKGDNLDELRRTIFSRLPAGPYFYDKDTVTTETEREIVSEIIREKSLYVLKEEVPHGIAVTVEKMHPRKGRHLLDIEATIWCEKESHKGIIIGKKGAMLRRIGTDARYEIEKMTGTHCDLKLWVRVEKGWRDRPGDLSRFGYREKD